MVHFIDNFTQFPTVFLSFAASLCRLDRGYIRDINGNCVCAPGSAVDIYGECVPCRIEDGYKVDETGRCVCALERGFINDERGRCVCPIEHGYKITPLGECVIESRTPGCASDQECADHQFCMFETKTCEDACLHKVCGVNALCNATNHQAICQCITGYTGNPEIQCSESPVVIYSFFVPFFFMLDHIFMIIIGNFQIIQTSALNHLPNQTCWSAVWLMVLRPKST